MASLSAARTRAPASLPLASVINSPTLQTRPPAAHTANSPRLLQIGHVANLRGQWEARCGQTYQHVPLPPASVFALQPAAEGAPAAAAHPHVPTLPLLATMAEHRRGHADTFQWQPLLLAGMPYPPRRNELHPHGIQARMLGSDMGAGEPPVVGHTPEVFAQRVAIHQFRQALSACVQIGLKAGQADSRQKA